MDPDQTQSEQSPYCLLPRTIWSEVHLNICSGSKKQITFSGVIYYGWTRMMIISMISNIVSDDKSPFATDMVPLKCRLRPSDLWWARVIVP